MKTPPTIPKDVVARVEDKILQVYLDAQSIWGRNFDLPAISYDLLGRCAGRAHISEKRIRLNPVLLLENQVDFIERTVPHEVAHLVTYTIYPESRLIKPHGREWKAIMQALGYKPIRCHSYDTTNAQVRRERRFTYACACRAIQETARTHFKIQRGGYWPLKCRNCQSVFRFRQNEGGLA